jgi:hypothetical protein
VLRPSRAVPRRPACPQRDEGGDHPGCREYLTRDETGIDIERNDLERTDVIRVRNIGEKTHATRGDNHRDEYPHGDLPCRRVGTEIPAHDREGGEDPEGEKNDPESEGEKDAPGNDGLAPDTVSGGFQQRGPFDPPEHQGKAHHPYRNRQPDLDQGLPHVSPLSELR